MLGVRREGVTEAAGKLQDQGLIHYSRGRITVLDRPGLEARVCECYAVVKKEYDRLLPDTTTRASIPALTSNHPGRSKTSESSAAVPALQAGGTATPKTIHVAKTVLK
jgi:hypothetical protein